MLCNALLLLFYFSGNWKDLNEFFEYCTEWEPSNSLYFGDNVLQDVLAPKKFTTTIDTVAVCEDMLAEGMVDGEGISHPHARSIASPQLWGSYFFHPDPRVVRKKDSVLNRASSCRTKMNSSTGNSPETPGGAGLARSHSSAHTASAEEVNRALATRRQTTMRTPQPSSVEGDKTNISLISRATPPFGHVRHPRLGNATPKSSLDLATTPRSGTPTAAASSKCATPPHPAADQPTALVTGPKRVNTLWGSLIRDHAKMCIPDVDVLADYPIDYKFPAFGRNKRGETVGSGFFPADPSSLHTVIPLYGAQPPGVK